MFGRLASHSSSVRLVDRAPDQTRRTYLNASWLKIQHWSRLGLRSRIAQGDRGLEVEDARCAFAAQVESASASSSSR
jgi:enterochelin esterase-like enzyme